MNPTEALEKAISLVGSASARAARLGLTKGAISQWKGEGKKVPADHCPEIEKATNGKVRCEDLRPDVDWSVLRRPCTGPKYGRRSTDKRP